MSGLGGGVDNHKKTNENKLKNWKIISKHNKKTAFPLRSMRVGMLDQCIPVLKTRLLYAIKKEKSILFLEEI